MGDKVHTLVIKVDLSRCRCRKCIQDYLCKMRCKLHIVSIVFEDKDNTVLVSGCFDPEELKRKLLCKFTKIIIDIYIKVDKPPPPPPITPDKCKIEIEKIVNERIEILKKECEEKCKKCNEVINKLKCKCKCKCSCKCKEQPEDECNKDCGGERLKCKCKRKCSESECSKDCDGKRLNCKCKCKCSCTCIVQPVIPSPHVTGFCCTTPCPCFVTWCNNYRCCSCGMVGWPGWWGREPCPAPVVICESAQPQCGIM